MKTETNKALKSYKIPVIWQVAGICEKAEDGPLPHTGGDLEGIEFHNKLSKKERESLSL